MVGVGGRQLKGRAQSHQPGSSGAAATPVGVGVTAGAQASGDPRWTTRADLPVFLHSTTHGYLLFVEASGKAAALS